jgi:hypothetical protein
MGAPGVVAIFVFTLEICSHKLEPLALGDVDAYERRTIQHMIPARRFSFLGHNRPGMCNGYL